MPRTTSILMLIALLVSLLIGSLLSFFVDALVAYGGGILLAAYLLFRIKRASDRLLKAAPPAKRRSRKNL